MMNIKFGTDGWRAVIAKEFTFDNVRIVAQAIADYVKGSSVYSRRKGLKRLIVGYDRRFMSDIYARLIADVLTANRVKVYLTLAPTPTPAISFAIKARQLDAGIVVTASHNPPVFNGIKVKTHQANSADEKVTGAIESFLGKTKPKLLVTGRQAAGPRQEMIDAGVDYINFLKAYVDIKRVKRLKSKVLVDYMYGAGIGYIEAVLGRPANVQAVRCHDDPLFGGVNPEPILRNMRYSASYMKEKNFDLCLALDGDADRIGALGPGGRFITSGQIIALILLHLFQNRKLTGAVVKTISGTTLIEKICAKYGLTMFETPVGFKYISALMLKENVLIGGEESGGIGFCGYIPERDGILSSLLLLEMLAFRGKRIDKVIGDMEKEYGVFCYDRIDMKYPFEKAQRLTVRLKKEAPKKVAGKRVLEVKTYDGIKFILEDSSWLLLRFSGTEPIIRIYAEADSDKKVKRLLSAGMDITK